MRVPRTRGMLSGFLLIILGLWAALIPFVGPYFSYGFGLNSTWVWHTSRLWMNVLPGAAAVLAGLVLLGFAERLTMMAGAWLACAAGAWLAVATVVSTLWNHSVSLAGVPLGGPHHQALEYLGFYYGAGAVILFLGATALGRLSVTRGADAAVVRSRAEGPAPLDTAAPTSRSTVVREPDRAVPEAPTANPTIDPAPGETHPTQPGRLHRSHPA